jgi:hypothetical protein
VTIDFRQLAASARLGLVFTVAEALAAGITPSQLRSRGVRPVFRGVMTVADDPDSLLVRALAAVRLAGPHALVCAETALELWGVPMPDTTAGRMIHVWVPAAQVGPRVTGICVHRSRLQDPPKVIDAETGLTAVPPCECWLQAAATASVRDLVIMADGLMRFERPVAFAFELDDAVRLSHRRPGLARARRALGLAREGTDSPAETLVRLALVEAGLPSPEVNYPIRASSGRTLYRLDMAYPDDLVAVEYDGAVHVADATQMRRDQTRRRHLEDLGWRIVTATAVDLPDPAGLIASVRRARTRPRDP